MESEPAISCNHASCLIGGIGTPIEPQNPQFLLPTKCAGLKNGAEFEGRSNQCPVRLETNFTIGNPSLKLLVIFCYTCRQKPSIMSSDRFHSETDGRKPQPNIRWRLGSPVEDGKEGVKEPEGSRTPHKTPQN